MIEVKLKNFNVNYFYIRAILWLQCFILLKLTLYLIQET